MFNCLLLTTLLFSSVIADNLENHHDYCDDWAAHGECENNPDYMIENCALACSLYVTVLEDKDESCEEWAKQGECAVNPTYMLSDCALSCSLYGAMADESTEVVESIYDIVEKDIHGNDFSFDSLRGKVTLIVNVASHCGYTQENYDFFKKYVAIIASISSTFSSKSL